MKVDTLIHSAGQLLTLAGGPQWGHDLGRLQIIERGALAILDDEIHAVGTSTEIQGNFEAEHTIDAQGSVVMPGFVDPHTHLVWSGIA